MSAPALSTLASERAAALTSARTSDLSALRSIIRHLDLLAEDYAADFDISTSLRRAARWAAHARDALQKQSTDPATPQSNDAP